MQDSWLSVTESPDNTQLGKNDASVGILQPKH